MKKINNYILEKLYIGKGFKVDNRVYIIFDFVDNKIDYIKFPSAKELLEYVEKQNRLTVVDYVYVAKDDKAYEYLRKLYKEYRNSDMSPSDFQRKYKDAGIYAYSFGDFKKKFEKDGGI